MSANDKPEGLDDKRMNLSSIPLGLHLLFSMHKLMVAFYH